MHNAQPLAALLPEVIALVATASEAVMDIYGSSDFGIRVKSDDSPVTSADLAANDIIVAGLSRLTPTIPIISEESLNATADLSGGRFWLVDPIDGTKEFIARNGEFTLNVGLIAAGRPVLGVVAAPALNLLYYGSSESGAYKKVGQSAAQSIQTQPWRARPLAAISRSHQDTLTTDWLKQHDIGQTLAVGSSLKLCYVADHTVDVCPRLGPQHEWDIAAADAVLRAAGGSLVVAETGQPLVYGAAGFKTPYYIASGPSAESLSR